MALSLGLSGILILSFGFFCEVSIFTSLLIAVGCLIVVFLAVFSEIFLFFV